jgi:hypothetical protein
MAHGSLRSVRYTYDTNINKKVLVDPIECLFAVDNFCEKYLKSAVIVSGTLDWPTLEFGS